MRAVEIYPLEFLIDTKKLTWNCAVDEVKAFVSHHSGLGLKCGFGIIYMWAIIACCPKGCSLGSPGSSLLQKVPVGSGNKLLRVHLQPFLDVQHVLKSRKSPTIT